METYRHLLLVGALQCSEQVLLATDGDRVEHKRSVIERRAEIHGLGEAGRKSLELLVGGQRGRGA